MRTPLQPIPNPGHRPVHEDEKVWLWFRAEEGPRKSSEPRRAGSYDWKIERGRPFWKPAWVERELDRKWKNNG